MKLETSSNEDIYSEDENYIENSCDDSSYFINYNSSDTETESECEENEALFTPIIQQRKKIGFQCSEYSKVFLKLQHYTKHVQSGKHTKNPNQKNK